MVNKDSCLFLDEINCATKEIAQLVQAIPEPQAERRQAAVNKDNTFTVGELLKMLADGRVTPDMPLAVWDHEQGAVRGFNALEIHTYKDGSKALTFFEGAPCADIKDCESSSEVFP